MRLMTISYYVVLVQSATGKYTVLTKIRSFLNRMYAVFKLNVNGHLINVIRSVLTESQRSTEVNGPRKLNVYGLPT